MRFVAPCGHAGVPIVGQFVLCSVPCHKRCPVETCRSRNVERFDKDGRWHCWKCGGLWRPWG